MFSILNGKRTSIQFYCLGSTGMAGKQGDLFHQGERVREMRECKAGYRYMLSSVPSIKAMVNLNLHRILKLEMEMFCPGIVYLIHESMLLCGFMFLLLMSLPLQLFSLRRNATWTTTLLINKTHNHQSSKKEGRRKSKRVYQAVLQADSVPDRRCRGPLPVPCLTSVCSLLLLSTP